MTRRWAIVRNPEGESVRVSGLGNGGRPSSRTRSPESEVAGVEERQQVQYSTPSSECRSPDGRVPDPEPRVPSPVFASRSLRLCASARDVFALSGIFSQISNAGRRTDHDSALRATPSSVYVYETK